MFQGPGGKSGDKRLVKVYTAAGTTYVNEYEELRFGRSGAALKYAETARNNVGWEIVGPEISTTVSGSNYVYLPSRGWAADDGYMYFGSFTDYHIISSAFYGNVTTGNLYIGTDGGGSLVLRTSGSDRWTLDNSGNFLPSADSTFNIGSTSNRVKNIYLTSGGIVSFATGDVQIVGFSGQLSINAQSAVVNSVGITTGAVYPVTNDGVSLGTSANKFSDLCLAAGAIITFSTDPVNITAGTSSLTVNASSFITSGNQFTVTAVTADIGSVKFTTNAIRPATNDGVALGSSALKFSDLYLASGAVLQFSTEATSITHSASVLTIAASTIVTNSIAQSTAAIYPVTNDGVTLGTSANKWADLFLASGAVIDMSTGNVTLTHGTSALTVVASTITLTCTQFTLTSAATADIVSAKFTTAAIAPTSDGGLTLGTSSNKFSNIHLTSGSNIYFSTDNTNQRIQGAGGQLSLTATSVVAIGRFQATLQTQLTGGCTIGGVLTLTTGQVEFPAAANISAGANTLDDYEEGLFTPTWTPNTTGTYTIGYGISTSGNYTKIGNRVSLSCLMAVTTHTSGTGTGQMGISGLPFVGTTHERSPGRVQAASSGYRGFELCGMATAQSVARAQFKVATTGATSNLNLADITTGSETFLFSISYASSS